MDAAAILLVALLGLRALLSRPREPAAHLMGLLSLAVIAHIMLARDDYSYWIPAALQFDVGHWRPALNLARNAAPGLFMLLVHRLFTDRARVPPILLALFGLQLFLEEPVQAFLPPGTVLPRLVAEALPAALEAVFAGLAIYWTLEGWRRDLIDARRWARALFVAILGVQVIGSALLLRALIAPDTIANYQAHVGLSGLAFAALVAVAFALLRPDPLADLAPPRTPAVPPPEARDVQALAALSRLMDVEAAHRDPALSLSVLAERVQLPEYRLRRLIHRELGFRNLAAFLHHHRVADACRHLRDPAQRRTPILTIALMVGYTSVNTFNRGFREVTGVSPSEFRAGSSDEPRVDAPQTLLEF